MPFAIACFLLMTGLTAVPCAQAAQETAPLANQPLTDPLTAEIAGQLICYPIDLIGIQDQKLYGAAKELCLSAVYQRTGLRPLWVTDQGPGPDAHVIMDFLKNAENEGLDSRNYDIGEIAALSEERQPRMLARLDTLLTYNLIKYMHDASLGRIRPGRVDPPVLNDTKDLPFAPLEAMDNAVHAPDLAAYLSSLPPPHHHYADLKKALAVYRAFKKNGGWPIVPEGKTIRPNDHDDRIPAIMDRLSVTGDLAPGLPSSTWYDPPLQQAVRKFQRRHGLSPDGAIGPKTLASMNVSASARVRQIIINMARWRWQKRYLGEKYVLVNIANFDLAAIENGKEVFRLPVIVGKTQFQTPVFSDRIVDITLNPYWNIPTSIAQNEELPRLRKDAYSLMKRQIRVFSGWGQDAREIDTRFVNWHTISPGMMRQFRLRQDPGPWNALGQVKFNSPNHYDVYLHDTPSRQLFSQHRRDFSHGCIRVKDPLKLVEFALSRQPEAWPIEKIEDRIRAKKPAVIHLAEPLPVHITYQTSWVDKSGMICFNNDIYGRDERLRKVFFSE